MELHADHMRINYDGGTDGDIGYYSETPSSASELDVLLKVRDEGDAIAFMDSFSPLYGTGGIDGDFALLHKRPSEMGADILRPMVNDVMNTVSLMRLCHELYVLSEKDFTVDDLKDAGLNPRLNNEKYGQVYYLDARNRVSCVRVLNFISTPCTRLLPGANETLIWSEGAEEVQIIFGVATDEGESLDTYRQAIVGMIDQVTSYMLEGICIVSRNLRYAMYAKHYGDFLWYAFFERLIKGEIRTCRACGLPFVPNMGEARERGGRGKQKAYCGNACRSVAAKGRKAASMMRKGVTLDEAARAAHILKPKLERFLELNPNEMKGANNG